jgi:hypothetical protein
MNSLFSPQCHFIGFAFREENSCMYIHASYQLVDGCDQRLVFFFNFLKLYIYIYKLSFWEGVTLIFFAQIFAHHNLFF